MARPTPAASGALRFSKPGPSRTCAGAPSLGHAGRKAPSFLRCSALHGESTAAKHNRSVRWPMCVNARHSALSPYRPHHQRHPHPTPLHPFFRNLSCPLFVCPPLPYLPPRPVWPGWRDSFVRSGCCRWRALNWRQALNRVWQCSGAGSTANRTDNSLLLFSRRRIRLPGRRDRAADHKRAVMMQRLLRSGVGARWPSRGLPAGRFESQAGFGAGGRGGFDRRRQRAAAASAPNR